MSVGKRREKYFYDIQFCQWSSLISVQCICWPYGFLLAIPINSFLFTKPSHSHDYLFKTFAILHTVSSIQLNSCGFMLANRHITLGVSIWCIAFVIERKDCSFLYVVWCNNIFWRCIHHSTASHQWDPSNVKFNWPSFLFSAAPSSFYFQRFSMQATFQ